MYKAGTLSNVKEAKNWFLLNYCPHGEGGIPSPFMGGGFHMTLLINGDAPNLSIRSRYTIAEAEALREFIDNSPALC